MCIASTEIDIKFKNRCNNRKAVITLTSKVNGQTDRQTWHGTTIAYSHARLGANKNSKHFCTTLLRLFKHIAWTDRQTDGHATGRQ